MRRVVVGLFALSIVGAACGDDSTQQDAAATSTTGAADDATSSTGGSPTTGDEPRRIVSLSPSATETLFAIGAGGQVIAVDEYSNYPAEAAELPNDLSGFEPNAEAIAALQPDLVLHDGTTELGAQLDELGIDHWVGAAAVTIDDVYSQIEQLGAATGHVAEAAELVGEMTADIDAAVASIAPPAEPLTYFHELDNTLYSATSKTFIGSVYSLFGLTNIADEAGGDQDYPQLSAEFVIAADPDVIFLADAEAGESADTVAARPGWAELAAVKSGAVIPLDADIASRWGPRVVEFVQLVAESLAKVPEGV
jgi:iron complex transport system substrate-binding protein